MRSISHLVRIAFVAVPFCLGSPLARAGEVILNFSDIPIPGGTDSAPFFTYSSQGFSLSAINPPTGFLSGFEAHGPNSLFYAGEIGVVAFAPASPPDNVISLTQENGQPFSILSIDLARNFAFDPAPTVDFTGTRSDGSTVSESFTVTVPLGTAAFQTFDFTGFTDLVAVSWGQPVLADGLNQFANIHLATVPEPSAVLLMALGTSMSLGFQYLARRRGPRHEQGRSAH